MKKAIVLFLGVIIMTSCGQKVKKEDLSKLNGYWEIEKVILSDGEKKEYKINETIDFFEIKNDTGFRKKVKPQLDGSYLSNNLTETIKIIQEKEAFYINYTTSYGKWKEEILEISDDKFTVKNQQDIEYYYKRQIPFSIK